MQLNSFKCWWSSPFLICITANSSFDQTPSTPQQHQALLVCAAGNNMLLTTLSIYDETKLDHIIDCDAMLALSQHIAELQSLERALVSPNLALASPNFALDSLTHTLDFSGTCSGAWRCCRVVRMPGAVGFSSQEPRRPWGNWNLPKILETLEWAP